MHCKNAGHLPKKILIKNKSNDLICVHHFLKNILKLQKWQIVKPAEFIELLP